MKYIIYTLVLLLMLICSLVYPQKYENEYKPTSTLGSPIRAYINLNSITTILKNTGLSDISPGQDASGFVYPFGTGKTAVYCSGLIWGAKISSDPQVRVGGSTYREGLQSGWIDASGNVIPPTDPQARIFRVRPEVYPGGPPIDLSREAMDEVKTEQEIRVQYELDWTEWPADLGAPFFDANANGVYDSDPSSGDIPGIKGAAQTIWFVANDQDAALTTFLYGTLPLGIEYQATMWEYKDSLGFENLFFRKYKLINKTDILGNPTIFEDMYISMWSDPDIGDAGDDFAGCDTLLNLGFAYNASPTDAIYDPLPPPAVGFDLIRGPLVPGNPGEDRNGNGIDDNFDYGHTENNETIFGFINLPMTAFYYFTSQDPLLSDPILGSAQGANQFYNFMQGKIGNTGENFINPITGLPTPFALSGNPVTGSGWIDGIQLSAGDRRLGLSTGPFQMAPGDTQVVVIAEIAGGAESGISHLNAISLVKNYSQIAQDFYDEAFPLPVNVSNETSLPIKFKLSQNYPNPFNPVTSIKYVVGSQSYVTLKVFDVLGNEIETLVNEEKQIGTYELTWYAEGLPSGVYFYQLRVTDPKSSSGKGFVETKKMVLIK